MPELPDVSVYVERLAAYLIGEPLQQVRLKSLFLVRTVEPPLTDAVGRRVLAVSNIGKRLVLSFDEQLHLVVHLMIAGRLRWRRRGAGLPGRIGLCAFDFPAGTLLLTEAGSRKRAALHVVSGDGALTAFDRGGLSLSGCSEEAFTDALSRERHTLKRALTDPSLLSGVGNAYSDEILHRACLSPFRRTDQLDPQEWTVLHRATLDVLAEFTERLRDEVGDGFPEKVTAFRDDMAVHGRYGKPCPRCEAPVQRILYAENESNYCARCQTGGRLLADRVLSRLMKDDWPATLEELEDLGRS